MGEVVTCKDAQEWDEFIIHARDGTLLQTWGWGELKARYGWAVNRYFWTEGGRPEAAMAVLRRPFARGMLAFHYAPRGPVLNGRKECWPEFWAALKSRLKRERGVSLRVDPEWSEPDDSRALQQVGGRPNKYPIQHQATIVVDIAGGTQAMSHFKESTRRNIRRGENSGIVVESSDSPSEVASFYHLLQETGARQGFVPRTLSYYQDLVAIFRERSQVSVFLASLEGNPVAGAIMLYIGPTLVYLFGATANAIGDLKPGYLLHWRAIQEGQRRGCTRYDMWGVPLNPQPGRRGYGFYTFKSRFNGEVLRFIGLYELPVRPLIATVVGAAESVVRSRAQDLV